MREGDEKGMRERPGERASRERQRDRETERQRDRETERQRDAFQMRFVGLCSSVDFH